MLVYIHQWTFINGQTLTRLGYFLWVKLSSHCILFKTGMFIVVLIITYIVCEDSLANVVTLGNLYFIHKGTVFEFLPMAWFYRIAWSYIMV